MKRRAYYHSSIKDLLELDVDSVLGMLANAAAERGHDSAAKQVVSWRASIEDLRTGLKLVTDSIFGSEEWGILLEYPVPRIERRIDCVLLSEKRVYVIEYKFGGSQTSAQALAQAQGYRDDLQDFHEGCAGTEVVPVAISRSFGESYHSLVTTPDRLWCKVQQFESEDFEPRS